MNDKISGPSSRTGTYTPWQGPAGPERAGAGTGGRATGRSAPPRVADDAVSVTDDAELLRALDAQIAATPAVNAARVEEVRDALANGEYRIDPERIAEKLLATEGGVEALLLRN